MVPCLANLSIYLIRLTLATYYGYRTSSVQARLEELQKQRDSTIEKLKTATRYNSTQEILKRYGGTPTPKVKTAVATDRKTTSRQGDTGTPKDRRTTFVPPPTANIPRRNEPIAKFDMSQSSPPQSRGLVGQQDQYPAVGLMPPSRRPSSPQDTSAEFAPNAFSAAPQYAQVNEGSRWYDRIMDVLLGEDETLPRARLALICNDCRLVNGQAPPGIKRLEDVGEWRCGGCGTMNGEESEARKIVANLKEQNSSERERTGKKKEYRSAPADQGIISEPVLDNADEGHESDVTQYSSESADEDRETEQINEKAADPAAEPETPRRRSTRPRGHSKDVR